MSIASRITSIEGHISDIYDSVELTGVDTTDIDKNLVNVPNTLKEGYVDIINNGTDTLYNNFPKVSGEGTSLTLNNTYQAPMRNLPKGNTSQTGTPTPSSPIDVDVVSGDNSISICGKNLAYTGWATKFVNAVNNTNVAKLETKDNRNCLFFTSSAGYGSYPTKNFTLGIKFKENTQYTLSYDILKETTTNKTVAIYYTDGTRTINIDLSTINTWTHQTITSTANKTIDYIAPYYTSGNTYIDINTWQIEEGTSATTYEAYNGTTYPINLPVENLVDLTHVTLIGSGSSQSNVQTNSLTLNGTGAWGNTYFFITNTNKNTNYTASCKAFSSLARKSGISVYGASDTSGSGLTSINGVLEDMSANVSKTYINSFNSGNYEYLAIRLWNNANGTSLGSNVDLNISDIMLEVGTKVNTFVTYGTTPIELCKIGNYQDQFKKATGKNLAPINLESETYNTLEITNNNNGTFTLLGNPTGSFGRDIATNLTLKAGTYTISANSMPSGLYIALDNEADTQLSNGTLSKTFTLASDTTYTSLGIWFTKNKDYDVTIKLQIEEGSSVTEWQPMNGWYLHKEIYKKVFDGTETLSSGGSSASRTVLIYTVNENIEPYTSQTQIPNIISSHFIPVTQQATWANGNVSRATNNTYGIYFILGSGYTTETGLQWLVNNNVITYTPLATPTNEPIPSNLINQLEELYIAKSKENQTNISQINNDLPFIVSASALKKG